MLAVIGALFANGLIAILKFMAAVITGSSGMMAEALITQPGEADAGIRKLLENPAVVTIHAHNAARGCFAAKIERA